MKVWINGTFDILHIGHIRLLNFAKSFGSIRVGLDTDERVREKKGIQRPFNKLEYRMEFISSITGVDSVVSFGTDDELRNCIKEYEPDVMVIGGEYKYKEIIGLEYVPKIEFFDKVEDISTTKILNDEKDVIRKQQQKERANAIDDVSELEDRIREGTTAYKLLVAEFEPCGEFRVHTIGKGQNQGRKVKKQKWSKRI